MSHGPRLLLVCAAILMASACASSTGGVRQEGPDGRLFVGMSDVEEEPRPVGGMGALRRRVQYPEAARKANVEGMVYLRFFVEKDGSTSGYEVLRSPSALLGKEAERVVRATPFEPARYDGSAVRTRITLPLQFALE